jgi:molybdate transport system ATP-binding protein
MVLSGFDFSIVHTTPVSQKNIVSQWLELVHLNHQKFLKTLSVGQQRLALIIRAVIKHPIINFRRQEGLDDENVADFTTNYPFLNKPT